MTLYQKLLLFVGLGVNVQTLNANLVLDSGSEHFQVLTPSGSNRNVTLDAPGTTSGVPSLQGLWYILRCDSAASYSAVVKNGGTTLVTLAPGDWAYVACGGALGAATWKVMASSAGLSTLTLTGAITAVGATLTGPVVFKDASTPTKVLSFVMSSITGGQTRTLTMADANVDLADVGTNTAAIAKFGSADGLVRSTIAVADAPAGATVAAMSIQLTRADGTNVATARQVYIVASLTRYRGNPTGTVTFDTPTVGTIIASGTSWALVQTNATGAFACNANDAADETVYFSVTNALGGVSAVGEYAAVVGSNSDAAIWSA